MKKIKLFCLPYAGGSAAVYKKWKKYLHNSIELIPVELSGRGKRFGEGAYNSIDEASEDVFKSIREHDDQTEYAVFGHSMGSLIAYELYYKIIKYQHKPPIHMFFSGFRAPDQPSNKPPIYDLPDKSFTEEFFKLGGTPRELIENEELLSIFLPILRGDYKIVEKYDYIQREEKINTDITVFYGNEDDLTNERVNQWSKHTKKIFKSYCFNGNHFFIHDYTEEIVNIINKTILGYIY